MAEGELQRESIGLEEYASAYYAPHVSGGPYDYIIAGLSLDETWNAQYGKAWYNYTVAQGAIAVEQMSDGRARFVASPNIGTAMWTSGGDCAQLGWLFSFTTRNGRDDFTGSIDGRSCFIASGPMGGDRTVNTEKHFKGVYIGPNHKSDDENSTADIILSTSDLALIGEKKWDVLVWFCCRDTGGSDGLSTHGNAYFKRTGSLPTYPSADDWINTYSWVESPSPITRYGDYCSTGNGIPIDTGSKYYYKVVARIPYNIIIQHKNPSIYFVYPQSYTFGDWSVYNQPRSYDIGWNLNGDQHTHTYYLNYVNPTSDTARGNTGNNQTGTTSIVLTPSHARDTIYNVEAVIYDDAKTSLTANANKNFGIFGLPSLSLKVGSAQASSSGNNTSVDVSSDLKLIAGQSVNITIVKGALGSDTSTTSTVNFNVGSTKNDLVHVAGWSNQSNGSSQTLTTTYTPTREGASYVFRAILNHNTSNEIREVYLLGIKTYINPTIDNLTGNDYFSPQDNSTFSWTNNVSSGTSIDSFTQKLTIASSTVNNATYSSNSVVLAPSGNYWVQNIFNNATRSTAVLSSSVTVSLSNSSSGQSVSSTKSFRVQYQPTKQPSSVSISNSGQTICIDDNPTTTISWSYPHTAGAAGVVSGYKVRVYSDSSYSNLVSTKDVSATYLQNNMSVSLNNATDLKRGVLNYVTITPYYTYPSDSTKLEGESNTIYYGTLVKPYKKMGPLTINYPINNTTWHNKYFRVLFTLPIDGDFDTYSSEIQSNYNYSNIQIDVNGTVYDYSTTYTSGTAHPEIFSKDPVITDITNTAQLKMAINPSLISNFADANTFVIKVRAQKGNYYFTSAEMQDSSIKTWSEWASVTLNKTALTEQNLTVGLEIDDTHYMYPHNGINRLLACYPIGSNDNRNIDRARGDLICRSEYQGIYQTMINLINGVNGWCTYDRANVKFNKDIPSFTAIVEIITSAKTGTDRYGSTGRNYMNLLTEYMNNCLQ